MKSVLLELLVEVLKDLPCEVKEYGVVVSDDVNVLEIITGIRRLLNTDRGMSVRSRFAIGDFYNKITKRKGLRKEVVEAITGEFGGKTYQLIRTYGWVANKWPIDLRNDEKPWVWWIRNEHGAPDKDALEYETPLEVLKIEHRDQGIVVHCATKGSRKFIIHIPTGDMPAAQRDEDALDKFFNGASLVNEEPAPYDAVT